MKPILISLTILPLFCVQAFAETAKKPNIILILADDLGAHDVGCFGSTYYQTPNIDALAKRGVKLTQAYAASPLCSPTRSSILTGVHPARSGITQPSCHLPQIVLEKNLSKPSPAMRAVNAESLTRMKPEYFTLAEALRETGYATAHFGKWHLGFNQGANDHFEPKDQGFDLDFPHTPNAAGPRLTAVRHKDWKLVFARPARGDMSYMPGWLTSHIESLPETQLFNLRTDPAESKNLAAENPAVVKQIIGFAAQSRATLGDYTGPGKEDRFFDAAPRWPATVTTIDGPEIKTSDKAKAKREP